MDEELITPHFPWSGTLCHDGTPIPDELRPNAIRLAGQLEIIRAAWALVVAPASPAIIPVCWYRTPAHNAALRDAKLAQGLVPGTAVNSQHMTGGAIDARPVRLADLARFEGCIRELLTQGQLPLIGGWGFYPHQWIHLDVRPRPTSGHVAFWEGNGVASEMA